MKNKTKIHLLVFYCLWLSLFPTVAENLLIAFDKNSLVFDSIDFGNDYNNVRVNEILHDEKGFIWLGTSMGLARYDGYKAVFYTNDSKTLNSISDNYVSCLFLCRNGRIWVGTMNGLNRFDRESENFKVYRHFSGVNESICNNFIVELYEDKRGVLWVGTIDGLDRFDTKAETFIHQPLGVSDNSNSRSVRSIIEDSQGNIWVGTAEGLNRIDRGTFNIKRFLMEKDTPYGLPNDNIMDICEGREGDLWIGTWGSGVVKYSHKRNRFEKCLAGEKSAEIVQKAFVTSICEDRNGDVWFGTHGQGLWKYSLKNRDFQQFVPVDNNVRSLTSSRIIKIFEDRCGILWIGTTDAGLNVYNPYRGRFKHLLYRKNDQTNRLNDNIIHCIYEDPVANGNVMWIGTYAGGVNRYDIKKDEFFYYKHQPGKTNSLSNNQVYSITRDEMGNLWVGTKDGLNRFNESENNFTVYKHQEKNPQSLSHNSMVALKSGVGKTLWIGTSAGLNRFDYKINAVTRIMDGERNGGSWNNDFVLYIHEQNNGQAGSVLWIGTYGNGLVCYNTVTTRFYRHTFNVDGRDDKNINIIRSIHEEGDGILWLATDGGLNRFDINTGQYFIYTEKDGLASKRVSGILRDDKNCLWLGTERGLSRYNLTEKTFKTFDLSHGIQIQEFFLNAYCKSKTGKLYFGGMGGLISFVPHEIVDNTHVPEVVFTRFSIHQMQGWNGGGNEIIKSISEKKEIHLSYKMSLFSIEFAALDYTWPQKNRYAFKMKGYVDRWVQLDTKHDFTFPGLSPGTYVLQVKACNNDGVWNETGRSLKIVITPPFYQTWWAYGFYFITIVLLVISIHRIRVRQLKKRRAELYELVEQRTSQLEEVNASLKNANAEITSINANLRESMLELARTNEELKEANELKSEFLGIAAHDLKNPLQVILGYTFILKTKLKASGDTVKELNAINFSVEKMLSLISDVLQTATIEKGKWEFNLKWLDIKSLAETIVTENQPIARRKQQRILFANSGNTVLYGDKRLLTQIMENLISNAVKYSPQEKDIRVRVEEEGDHILFCVQDEGPGFSEDDTRLMFKKFQRLSAKPTGGESSTGLGLSICKALVELHHGEIEVQSKLNQGTTFIVRFPREWHPNQGHPTEFNRTLLGD